MGEFSINGQLYRSRPTSAVEEWRLFLLCRPVLDSFVMAQVGAIGRQNKGPLQALAELDDQASASLFAAARSMCQHQADGGWQPADQELSLLDLMSFVVGAATTILGDFFAYQPTKFRPHSRDTPAFEVVATNGDKGWLFRPMLRGFCKGESYYDGTLHLAQIAELNDVIDVADENEYRARKAAEKAAR